MTILDLLPMPPSLGPPLPRFMHWYWPWLQPAEDQKLLPHGRGLFSDIEVEPPTREAIPRGRPAPATTYSNIEEIELLDIDKDLLMPRKIIVHRKARVGNE